jgi:hypothetical protein
VIRLVRRLVYRLGFRPRPGTVLYSPSHIDIEPMAIVLEHFRSALRQVDSEEMDTECLKK